MAATNVYGTDNLYSPEGLCARFKRVKRNRDNWNSLWANITRYLWPEMEYFETDPDLTTKGMRRNPRLYDATGTRAAERFPAVIESMLMPRNERWHALVPPEWAGEDVINDYDTRRYLEQFTALLFAARYDSASNFINAASELGMSLGAWGSGAMYIEDRVDLNGPFPILYRNVPLWEVWFEEGETGRIDRVWRCFSLEAQQLVQRVDWRENLPNEVIECAQKKPHDKFRILMMTERMPANVRRDDPNRIYQVYVLEKTKTVLMEQTLRSWPWVTPRLMKVPVEIYGRSPAMSVLPVIQSLQEVQRSFIKQAQMAGEPAILAGDEDSIGPIGIVPNYINFGALDEQGRERLKPWVSGQNINTTAEMLAEMRKEVEDAFFLSWLRIIEDNPDMTATAVMTITSQRGQMSAPMIGRLQSEWLQDMIAREIDILSANDLAPPMPTALRGIGGYIEFRYDNLLSRAQRAGEALGIVRTLEFTTTAMGVQPNVAANYDGNAAVRIFADIQGAPVSVLRDPKLVEQEQDRQAQQQAAATAATTAVPASQAIKNVADAQQVTRQ